MLSYLSKGRVTEMYFWITSGECGTTVHMLNAEQLYRSLQATVKEDEGVKDEYQTRFLDAIPPNEKGHWTVGGTPVVIIKGEIVVPKATKIVKEYELP